MPLDGGQLLNSVVFDRYPKLQFVFLAISAGFLACGAWYFADPLLTILATIMGFTLLAQYNQAKILIGILKEHKDDDGEEKALYRILEVLSNPPYNKWNFNQKYQLAKQLLVRFQHRLPKLKESVFALLLYVVTLGAPIFYMAPILLQDQFIGGTGRYWDESIEEAVSPEEKIKAIMNAANYYGMSDDSEKAKEYYLSAIEVSKIEPSLDKWQVVASLGLKITNNEMLALENLNSIHDAEYRNAALILEIKRLASYAEFRDIDSALIIKLYEIAKDSYNRIGDTGQAAFVLLSMSDVYKKRRSFQLAEQHLINATELVDEQEFDAMNIIHSALANYYFEQGLHVKAEDVWLKLFKLNPEESRNYVNQELYTNLGWNALANEEFDQAQDYFSKSYDILTSNKNKRDYNEEYSSESYSQVENRLDLVALSIAKEDLDAARDYLNQAKGLWKNSGINWKQFIEFQSDISIEGDDDRGGLQVFRAKKVRKALLMLKE